MSFGFAAAAVVGTGMSIASASGAFNKKVDSWTPTPQEMEASKWAKKTFALGQEIQQPLDGLAKKDLEYMKSPAGLAEAAGLGVNDYFHGKDINAPTQTAAATSGGPGSGRWWGSLYDTKADLNNGLYSANVGGRVGGMGKYITATNQYLGRKIGDLNSGLSAMTSGGQTAAQAQADRINAQIQRNIAVSGAMSGIGNTLIGAGMGGMGAQMKA